MSFAGTHRLIDFPLSNCRNAGLPDVWVVQQFNPISLSDHLANGRPWDLDRTSGGLLILQPRMGHDGRDGFPKGTADALWRNAPMIREFAPDALVVSAPTPSTRSTTAAVVDEHATSGAAVTMVTTEVEPGDAGRYGVVQLDGERVTEYVYKPDEPATSTISNEVFVFSPRELLDRLDALAEESDELEDLGDALLPGPRRGRPRPRAPLRRLLARRRDDRRLPLRAHGAARAPAADRPRRPRRGRCSRTRPRAGRARACSRARRVEQSMLATAATIGGTVERSVIGRGAVVEEGAVVRDSVVLPGAVVRSGATVERAILDDLVQVGARRDGRRGRRRDRARRPARRASSEDLPAGARFPEVD